MREAAKARGRGHAGRGFERRDLQLEPARGRQEAVRQRTGAAGDVACRGPLWGFGLFLSEKCGATECFQNGSYEKQYTKVERIVKWTLICPAPISTLPKSLANLIYVRDHLQRPQGPFEATPNVITSFSLKDKGM